MPRLLAAISAHGYGHAMQACRVLNALRARLPSLQLLLRTDVAPAFLRSRLVGEFTLYPGCGGDFGMSMRSAVEVDTVASAEAYRVFHRDWDAHLVAEADFLRASGADLVFADIPYLSLAAAAHVGIPAVALCSLHWADIYQHYCGNTPGAEVVHARIFAAYQSAALFLQPTPHMPMPGLGNTLSVGPLAELGTPRPTELRRRLGLGRSTSWCWWG